MAVTVDRDVDDSSVFSTGGVSSAERSDSAHRIWNAGTETVSSPEVEMAWRRKSEQEYELT